MQPKYYRLRAETEFLMRRWDDDSVIYVVPSRETHFVSSLGTALFESISEGPKVLESLKAEMFDLVEADDRLDLEARVEAALQSLEKIQLIESFEDAF